MTITNPISAFDYPIGLRVRPNDAATARILGRDRWSPTVGTVRGHTRGGDYCLVEWDNAPGTCNETTHWGNIKPAGLIPPTVNLNGEALEPLLQKHLLALNAITMANDALQQCFPHGRDYPEGNDAAVAARSAFAERMHTLEIIRKEIEAVAIAINDQRRA